MRYRITCTQALGARNDNANSRHKAVDAVGRLAEPNAALHPRADARTRAAGNAANAKPARRPASASESPNNPPKVPQPVTARLVDPGEVTRSRSIRVFILAVCCLGPLSLSHPGTRLGGASK